MGSNLEDPKTCRHPILKSAGDTNGGECLYCGTWVDRGHNMDCIDYWCAYCGTYHENPCHLPDVKGRE